MKITLTDGNQFINLDVQFDQSVEDVKALIEAETGKPMAQIQLFYQGNPILDHQRLSAKKINEGALIYFVFGAVKLPKPKQQQPKGKLGIAHFIKEFDKKIKSVQDEGYQFNHRRVQQFLPSAHQILAEYKDDHFRLSQLHQNHPQIAAAIQKNDPQTIAKILHRKNEDKIKAIKQKQRKFIELSKDPMNIQYQKLLQERIQQQNIDKNQQFAKQYIPQVFGHITMLYIKATINKIPINAFVDSGAQSTIMSQSLAERCGLMRLVDKKTAGTAVGVGTCKILGKIHAAQIMIEGKYLTCSFTVIQNNSTEFLLGLDMLRRFRCLIDLNQNMLIFQDGLIKTPFLSDGQVEKFKKPPVSKQQLDVKLKKLMEMGFTKAQSIEALRSSSYNEELAGNILMQRKYGHK